MTGKIASRDEWLAARKALLVREKALTHEADAVAAQLRELPMVRVDKDYVFYPATSSAGSEKGVKLADLFAGKRQLMVYHFMFAPGADAGCRGCSFIGEHIPDVRHLRLKDVQFAAVSRAEPHKLAAFREKTGWKFPWFSTRDGDFTYDFHSTLDEERAPVEYNFKDKEALAKQATRWRGTPEGDWPALSVFYKGEDGEVYHTYSTYARGLDKLLTTLTMLDMTPMGRQLGPQGPAEFKMNYEYEDDE